MLIRQKLRTLFALNCVVFLQCFDIVPNGWATGRGGTSCRAGKANAPPDFDLRGREWVFALPLFNGFTPCGPTVRLKFGEN